MPTKHFSSYITHASTDDHWEALLDANASGAEVEWTISSKASPGDFVFFYFVAPISAIVGGGWVQTRPKLAETGPWTGKYLSQIGDVMIFPKSLTRSEVMKAIPSFGWIRAPRKSMPVSREVSSSLFRMVQDAMGLAEEEQSSTKSTGKTTRKQANQGDMLESLDGRAGAGLLRNAEQRRKIETAAVKKVTEKLRREGWRVRSVERESIGYDLHCVKDDEELHAEVKGTSNVSLAFIITAGELRRSEQDVSFALYLVTDALSSNANIHRYTAQQIKKQFTMEPVSFRATLKSGRA